MILLLSCEHGKRAPGAASAADRRRPAACAHGQARVRRRRACVLRDRDDACEGERGRSLAPAAAPARRTVAVPGDRASGRARGRPPGAGSGLAERPDGAIVIADQGTFRAMGCEILVAGADAVEADAIRTLFA